MLTEEKARAICKEITRFAKGVETEIIIFNHNQSLTRYANNIITQNVHENEATDLLLRVIKHGKTVRVSTNKLDKDSLKSIVAKAVALVQHQKKGSKLPGLASQQEYQSIDSYVAGTASFSPQARAEAIKDAVKECKRYQLMGSGIFSNSSNAITIANSKKLFAYHAMTNAVFTLTAISSDSAGWVGEINKDVGQIKPNKIARMAVDKALKSRKPIKIPPGRYTVILEPTAVTGLLFAMGGPSLGALSYQEGRSFLCGKIGKKIMHHKITIADDVYHHQTHGIPFDFEGIPKQKVVFVEKGIAKGLVYDQVTAKKDKGKSTGHSLPQPNSFGPVPSNLVMMPGEDSLDEMIASTKKGILVTAFHYTNIVDPMKLVITGLTRNGTFLVENGKISKGIQNMRFTENVIDALSRVEMISRETKFAKGFSGGGAVVPALKIRDFNFSSETKF